MGMVSPFSSSAVTGSGHLVTVGCSIWFINQLQLEEERKVSMDTKAYYIGSRMKESLTSIHM